MVISIQKHGVKYDKARLTFSVSGKLVLFDTTHTIRNEKTGGSKLFIFSHSTGSEWDPNTTWVYKSEDGFTLDVANDDLLPGAQDEYVKAKTMY